MLVRFLARSFHNGSLVEAGEVAQVADSTFLGQHMVKLEGDNDHLIDPQPFAGAFRADLAYSVDPWEVRAQLTEEARQRTEARLAQEAAAEAARVAASVGEQPHVEDPHPPEATQQPDNPDQGGAAADG